MRDELCRACGLSLGQHYTFERPGDPVPELAVGHEGHFGYRVPVHGYWCPSSTWGLPAVVVTSIDA